MAQPEHQLVVIGGSAGAVEALRAIIKQLPADFAAAVLIVIHMAPEHGSSLPRLLSRWGPLPGMVATDGVAIEPGHIYVAPPGRHLLVEDGALRLVLAAEVNRARPAIDPLFISAAEARGADVIGVVLSGNLDDGSAGLDAVRRHGGLTLVQDPREASYPEMPSSAWPIMRKG